MRGRPCPAKDRSCYRPARFGRKHGRNREGCLLSPKLVTSGRIEPPIVDVESRCSSIELDVDRKTRSVWDHTSTPPWFGLCMPHECRAGRKPGSGINQQPQTKGQCRRFRQLRSGQHLSCRSRPRQQDASEIFQGLIETAAFGLDIRALDTDGAADMRCIP